MFVITISVLRCLSLLLTADLGVYVPEAAAEHSAQRSGGSSPEVDLLSNESFIWHDRSDEEEHCLTV